MIDENKKISNIVHNIILENREKLTISGVKDVFSFDDQIIILETELGMLTIKGENMKINKLSIDTSDVILDGNILSLNYSNSEPGKKTSNRFYK